MQSSHVKTCHHRCVSWCVCVCECVLLCMSKKNDLSSISEKACRFKDHLNVSLNWRARFLVSSLIQGFSKGFAGSIADPVFTLIKSLGPTYWKLKASLWLQSITKPTAGCTASSGETARLEGDIDRLLSFWRALSMEVTGLEMTNGGCQATSGHTAAQKGGKAAVTRTSWTPIHTLLQTLQHEELHRVAFFPPLHLN